MLWQLVLVELLIMGATSGIAVALGRSAPPEPTTFAPDASPAFILSGYELPPELTPERWLTEWRLDWLWVAVALFGLVVLLPRACQGARGAGTSGRWFRSVNWVVGLVVLTYMTSGPPSVYGRVLFSRAHGGPHGPDHGGPALPGPGRPGDAGPAGPARPAGRLPRACANGSWCSSTQSSPSW